MLIRVAGTQTEGVRLRTATGQHFSHPFAGSRYEAGAGGLALWAVPTCDQIGFDNRNRGCAPDISRHSIAEKVSTFTGA
jgi:hypothetical protein